jgi:lysophospholipase
MQNFKPPLIDQMTDASVGFHTLRDGHRLRYAMLWPKKDARGTVLIAPGRREFIEKKFIEVGREFLERGYRLIFFEWRGQGLSDRFLADDRRERDHIADFNMHLDDLNSFYASVVKPNQEGPLLVCGHSLGAHLLLRWLMSQETPPVAKVIFTGPMLALAGHMTHGAANLISWGALKLGRGSDYASMQHDYDEQDRLFAGNPLTNDAERFSIIEKYFTAYPEMTVGGVSWEWLHAAIKSMHVVQRRHNLERIAAPVLVLTGSKDRVTPPAENARYLKFLPKAEAISIAGGLHDLMNETESRRAEVWRHIDRFLSGGF